MTGQAQEVRFPSCDLELYGRLRLGMGTSAAPTLVLLPGLGFHTFEYEPLATLLADRSVGSLSIDYRGHGHSGGARGSWSLPELTIDTRRAIDLATERGADSVVLFGNSLGAMVAILAGAADERVSGVMAANAPDRIGDFLLTRPRRVLFAVAKAAARAVPLRISVGHFYGYDQLIDDPRWRSVIEQDPLIADARRLSVRAYRALLEDWDGRRAVTDLHKPLLLIQGHHDRLQPPTQGERLLAAAGQSAELTFVDTGHLPHLERPAAVASVVTDWLQRHGLMDQRPGSPRPGPSAADHSIPDPRAPR
jgi:pimeloyl-ACP methyl ester carboxylesterase